MTSVHSTAKKRIELFAWDLGTAQSQQSGPLTFDFLKADLYNTQEWLMSRKEDHAVVCILRYLTKPNLAWTVSLCPLHRAFAECAQCS